MASTDRVTVTINGRPTTVTERYKRLFLDNTTTAEPEPEPATEPEAESKPSGKRSRTSGD